MIILEEDRKKSSRKEERVKTKRKGRIARLEVVKNMEEKKGKGREEEMSDSPAGK